MEEAAEEEAAAATREMSGARRDGDVEATTGRSTVLAAGMGGARVVRVGTAYGDRVTIERELSLVVACAEPELAAVTGAARAPTRGLGWMLVLLVCIEQRIGDDGLRRR